MMLELKNCTVQYGKNILIKNQDFEFNPGITAIIGTSGSGKTTLLYLLGLLDDNATCEYRFEDKLINMANDDQKAYYRKHYIGYVFQDSNLLLHLTIKENWYLSADISGKSITDNDIENMLELMGLDKTGNEKIKELSGGQQQRVAIGMALIKNPKLLLLDEPTSALDSNTADDLIELLKKIAEEKKLIIIVASHSKKFIGNSDVIYEIKNKEIVCTKNSDYKEHKKENIIMNSAFSPFKYTVQYNKKFWKSKIMMSLLCSLVIAFFVISTSVTSQIIQRQQQLLSDMVNTEIKVSMNYNGSYYEKDIESFNKETYQKIIQMEHVKGYLPIVAMHTIIEGVNVDILPYNSYMGLEEFKNGNSTYISYDLAKLLSISQYPYSTNLEVMYDGILKDYHVEIKNSLKSTFSNTASTNKNVIFLEEAAFYNLFYRFVDKEVFIPNTLFVYVDYYVNLNQTKTAISSILGRGTVDSEFVDLKTLNESTEKFSVYLKIVSISLCVLLCLMLILIYSRYLINREYEFCILKSNGVTKKEVQLIMLNDIIIQGLLFTMSTLVYVVLSVEMMKLFNIIQKINYLETIMPIVILSFCTLLTPLYISIKKVNQLSPAKFLRR